MVTPITRKQLVDCVDLADFHDQDALRKFQEKFLWLWGAIVTDDSWEVNDARAKQLRTMFSQMPNTLRNLEALLTGD